MHNGSSFNNILTYLLHYILYNFYKQGCHQVQYRVQGLAQGHFGKSAEESRIQTTGTPV